MCDHSVGIERKKAALDPLNEMQSYVKAKKKSMGITDPVSGSVRQVCTISAENNMAKLERLFVIEYMMDLLCLHP